VTVAMSAPLALSRFTRASSLPPVSNIHKFHVISFIEGCFVDCPQSTSLRTLPVSCRTSLTSPGCRAPPSGLGVSPSGRGEHLPGGGEHSSRNFSAIFIFAVAHFRRGCRGR
jgi:hypothetical protein